MIGLLIGKVYKIKENEIILEVHGVGYRINFYHTDKIVLHQELMIYTYQAVSENDISLYGFIDENEYEMFVSLLKVKGIGPKLASNVCAKTSKENLYRAIETKDITYIESLPGIGKKTASQIILDLKGKLVTSNNNNLKSVESQDYKDVKDALIALGYKQNNFKHILDLIDFNDLSVQEAIKLILSKLNR